MVSPLRALIRISVYLALTAILLPLQAFALKFSKSLSVRLPIFYHRCCAGLLGFQIRVSGKICAEGPVLFACNHTSYSDIAILGSLLPASFVAKAEVANWPLFGLLAKLQPLLLQPVSLAYTLLDGMPVGRALRPYFAWYGDMMLAPHFWEVAGLGHATVDVVFHPPVSIQEYGSRKALADHCQAAVARGVSAANSGRLDGFLSASTS